MVIKDPHSTEAYRLLEQFHNAANRGPRANYEDELFYRAAISAHKENVEFEPGDIYGLLCQPTQSEPGFDPESAKALENDFYLLQDFLKYLQRNPID